eukprot:Blabericola_migrator_1__9210@NODE_493_length_8037_cov_350_734128_g378_i0_p7_GENE_NODE_493_length_8037_cov_350_734128_g378_i0NODE_493_length_8037_cov_350_734128_g378_i0_p7_ORF_typecomplete_len164_score32_35Histone/PF00125_24/4_6e15Histone/PF00125_24/1e03CBFD_NFYB_HMF/PF00808_23/0_006Histone_H2A_C/PF16211_5/1e04Histone_H2A_C/PF16211_5/0_016_NODE_493_length_8037_cov_350_734128_g378_i037504241
MSGTSSGKSPASSSSGSKPSKTKSKSRSEKAGLTFPISRIERSLKYGRFAKRIGHGAPIFMAAVLEYLVTEVLEISADEAKKHGKQRIIPKFVQLAVRSDEELSQFLGNVIIANGGAFSDSNAYSAGPTKKKKSSPKAQQSDDEEEAMSEDAGGDHQSSQVYV